MVCDCVDLVLSVDQQDNVEFNNVKNDTVFMHILMGKHILDCRVGRQNTNI